MRILLTGVGGVLAERVRDRLRETDGIVQLGGEWTAGVAVAEGTLADPAAVRAAAAGCQIAIHDAVGACEALVQRDADAMAEALEAQTANVVAAARSEGLRRVLMLSTARASALGDPLARRAGAVAPEALRPWPRLYSLRRAEDLALATAPDRVILLCPAPLLGPGLRRGALAHHLLRLLAGASPGSPETRLCLADLRDVPAAVEAAFRRGQPGRRYSLGSRPFRLGAFDAAALRWRARLAPSDPPSSEDEPAIGLFCEAADPRAAAADLGWWTRRPSLTLRDTLADLSLHRR